jgi:hypothetical protein
VWNPFPRESLTIRAKRKGIAINCFIKVGFSQRIGGRDDARGKRSSFSPSVTAYGSTSSKQRREGLKAQKKHDINEENGFEWAWALQF